MMSIDRTQQISPATLHGIQQNVASSNRAQIQSSSGVRNAGSGTKVSLSNQLQGLKTDDSQDINREHLDKIKMALAAGELPVDTDKIATSLVRDMFQLI